jgi:DNA-binding SARP family transcriptional activator
LAEREQLRQLRLHTLEWLCDRLSALGRHGQGIQAGLAAVAGDPLRESAWRALIRAHLAEGNRNEALRCQQAFRRRLADELGAAPTAEFDLLLDS